MPKLPGVSHRRAVAAFKRVGFAVAREGSNHIVLSRGSRILTIPRHNPVNAFTMAGIVRDAGMSTEEFKALL